MGAMSTVLYCFLFALLSFILFGKQRKNKPRSKLPPGSMGWPYLGETLQLYSQNPNVFFGTRQQRYMSILSNIYIYVYLIKPEDRCVGMEKFSRPIYLGALV